MGKPVVPGEFNGDLRDLPKPAPYVGPPIDVNPRPQRPAPAARPATPPAPKLDPLLESPSQAPDSRTDVQSDWAASSFQTPLRNFPGLGNSGVSNPDTVGDVGLDHYIQMVNAVDFVNGKGGSTFKIFDKAGKVLVNETFLVSLARPSTRCAAGTGDPIVLYDPLANRWLMSEIARPVTGQPDFLCVYISKTRNPVTGGWWTYAFQTPGFPDYPHYTVWPDAYYVGVNECPTGVGCFAAAYALDRKKMLRGQPATFNRFTTDQLPRWEGFNELTPADLDGKTRPPAGSPAYFVRHVDDEFHFGANTPKDYLEIWAFRANFSNPALATFTRLPNIPIADFDSNFCGGNSRCVEQPPDGGVLDALPEMTMHRVQYRNFSGLETLVGNFTVDADGQDRAGIRWFVANKIGRSNWFLSQQGTYSPDNASRWMASIAMDGCGNMALGYSVMTALLTTTALSGRSTVGRS